jgi:hypothetical protein
MHVVFYAQQCRDLEDLSTDICESDPHKSAYWNWPSNLAGAVEVVGGRATAKTALSSGAVVSAWPAALGAAWASSTAVTSPMRPYLGRVFHCEARSLRGQRAGRGR